MYLDQRAAMRAGLKYKDHDHGKAAKRMYMVNNPMIYLAENTTEITALKPRARVEYVKLGGEDLTEQRDVISLIQIISRGIKCEIKVGGVRKRTPKYKINHDSSSKSDGGRDDDSHGGGSSGRRDMVRRICAASHVGTAL